MQDFHELVEAAEENNPGFRARVAEKKAALDREMAIDQLEEIVEWLDDLAWQVNYMQILSVIDELWEIIREIKPKKS